MNPATYQLQKKPDKSPMAVRAPGAMMGLFLLVAVVLGYRMGRSGLATPLSDPISHVRAQDETIYASSAAGVADGGGWMTPKVLGRYMLTKPPLLVWLASLSMKLLGISAFALRLPVLLAACGATILLFLWSRREHSVWTAGFTIFLLIANPLWHVFARLGYTDMLVTAAIVAALFVVSRDPLLAWPWTIVLAGAAVGAGIMAKNVTGILPIPILFCFYIFRRERVPWLAILRICTVAMVVAAPWHIYQLLMHRQWLWADYVQTQLLGFGRNPYAQYSSDAAAWFYLKRLAATDPLLCVLAVVATPALLGAVRHRKTEAALLVSWLLVTGASVLLFQYRNLPYALGLIPPLCLIATGYGPVATGKAKIPAIAAAVIVFVLKATFGLQPWGLAYGNELPIPAEHWLQWYSQLDRPNELIAVNSDDEFYATAVPLRVRYCYIDNSGNVGSYAPHYALLGITVTGSQFLQLRELEPQFRERQREWGLNVSGDWDDPLASSIAAASAGEVADIVRTHPASDFYVPAALATSMGDAFALTHRNVAVSADRVFLLAADGAKPQPVSGLRLTRRKW